MLDALFNVLLPAGIAAVASVVGGYIALQRRPSSLFMSLALGFTAGLLLGTITFEMIPESLELSSRWVAVFGFAAGFLVLYGFDLFIHRGAIAGAQADQRQRVELVHRRRRPRGSEVTVLAGGTTLEELVEGLSIGVAAALQPGLALLIALAIAFDNISEGLSIGIFIRDEPEQGGRSHTRRVLSWTGLIGLSLFVSALVGWFFLQDLPDPILGFLFAFAGSGMLYLTVTDLVPTAQERQYRQSSAVATTAGFMVILILSGLF